MDTISKRLKTLSELSENWDGYNGSAPLPACIQNTETLLKLLGSKYTDNLDPEDIGPTPYGTIDIDWGNISVEVGFNACDVLIKGDPLETQNDFLEIIKIFKLNFK